MEIQFLSPTISSTRELFRLQDVAKLSEGDPVIRHKLAQLDLKHSGADQSKLEITSEPVRYRILLAGIDGKKKVGLFSPTFVFYHADQRKTIPVFVWFRKGSAAHRRPIRL